MPWSNPYGYPPGILQPQLQTYFASLPVPANSTTRVDLFTPLFNIDWGLSFRQVAANILDANSTGFLTVVNFGLFLDLFDSADGFLFFTPLGVPQTETTTNILSDLGVFIKSTEPYILPRDSQSFANPATADGTYAPPTVAKVWQMAFSGFVKNTDVAAHPVSIYGMITADIFSQPIPY